MFVFGVLVIRGGEGIPWWTFLCLHFELVKEEVLG